MKGMMKKAMAAVTLLAGTLTGVHAQTANWVTDVAIDEVPATATGVNYDSSSSLEAMLVLTPAEVSQLVGRTIQGIAYYINEVPVFDSSRSEVFIKRSDNGDYGSAKVMAKSAIYASAAGWNYHMFSTSNQYTVKAEDAGRYLYLGYKIKQDYGAHMGVDGATGVDGSRYKVMVGGQAVDWHSSYGHLMVGGMLDGASLASYGRRVYLHEVQGSQYVEAGTDVSLQLTVINPMPENCYQVLNVEVERNGVMETFEHKVYINNNGKDNVPYYVGVVNEPVTLKFRVATIGGEPNGLQQEPVVFRVAPNGVTGDFQVTRRVLIEKFTGQDCTYCPAGERTINSSIANLEEQVVRLDHHDGYRADNFTISESTAITDHFEVYGAPNCMLDRSRQPSRGTYAPIVFDPRSTTESLFKEALAVPAQIAVEISSTVDAATRVAEVTVKGQFIQALNNTKLTACLTYSGVTAYQSGSSGSYVHNDFPIHFFTAALGDNLTYDDEGAFVKTFTYTLPATFGKNSDTFSVDPAKVKVVAFVTGADGSVQNANDCALGQTTPNYDNIGSGSGITPELPTFEDKGEVSLTFRGEPVENGATYVTGYTYDGMLYHQDSYLALDGVAGTALTIAVQGTSEYEICWPGQCYYVGTDPYEYTATSALGRTLGIEPGTPHNESLELKMNNFQPENMVDNTLTVTLTPTATPEAVTTVTVVLRNLTDEEIANENGLDTLPVGDTPTALYDLQGRPVRNNPAPGIYIAVSPAGVRKVVL